MNYISVILILIAGIAFLLAIFTGGPGGKAPVVLPTEEQYSSSTFDVRFVYPDYYVLAEKKTGSAERNQYEVTLTADLESARESVSPTEGPVSIVVSVYQNDLDNLTAEQFIETTSFSNFKQSPDGVITPVQVAGKQAYWYLWDGLYHGESVVVAEGDWIYMFSVTYNSSKDQIWKDYRELLKTVRFE